MGKKSRLCNFIIKKTFNPKKGECNTKHLNYGYVAITPQGLREHNEHNLIGNLGLGALAGLVTLPLGGAGLLLTGPGLAIGASAGAEMLAVGSAIGLAGGAAVSSATAVSGHKTTKTTKSATAMELINMVGRVTNMQRRWWDQPGYDVEVQWKVINEWGDFETHTSWHDPEFLVSMTYLY